MSPGLLAIVALLYLGVAVDQLKKGDWPMFVVWAAYSVSNVGFIWKMLK